MKNKFLEYEFIAFSLREGLPTRNKDFPIYDQDNCSLDLARELRGDIKSFLLQYHEELLTVLISEEQHKQKLLSLCEVLSSKYSSVLFEGRFRLGVVQKIVNLFLKYLWTSNSISRPHHCPFDGIVKTMLAKYISDAELVNWTELTTLEEYEQYVVAASLAAKEFNTSIPEWELKSWKRRW